MSVPHTALLVMVMAPAGGNLMAMTGQMVRSGILTLPGVWPITPRHYDHALDPVEKSL